MNNSIGGVSQPGVKSLVTPGAGTSGAEKVGQRAGQLVGATKVSSPLSQSTDIAEEISMARSQFIKLDKRKLSKGDSRNAQMLELIRKIESIEQIQGLDDFKDSLTNNPNPNLTRKDFQQQAENNFEDVFHQYVALYEVADAYETRHGEGSAVEIYGAIKELENSNQQAIRIGLNLTEEAASLLDENNLDIPLSEVRQEYFDHVQDHKTLEKLYLELVQRHGADNFEDAVEMQLRLLSTDLACLESSTAPERLMAVINDMAKLKVLVGVHENCVETQEQIGRQPHNLKVAADELMAKLLGLVNRQWITETDFTGLAQELGVTELQAKIFFMNKAAETINLMPEDIFTNTEAQMAILDTIREVQDSLVIEEEGGDTPVNESYGTVGEATLDIGILQDIAAPMGIKIPGAAENKIPGVLEPVDPSFQGRADAAQEAKITQESTKSKQAEVSTERNLNGLSNKELRTLQDKDLERASGLYQQKGEKYVIDSSLTALKDSLVHGTDADNILRSLNRIAEARGGQFAKGLKIAITPEGSDKPLNLIPPGEELKGVSNLEELVKMAVAVLEEHFEAGFSNLNFEKIEKELASLKESISQLDSKMTSKPWTRSTGDELFNQLEHSRKFRVRADQVAGTVEVELDPPVDQAGAEEDKENIDPKNQ